MSIKVLFTGVLNGIVLSVSFIGENQINFNGHQ